jgi:hypothetical protein
MIYVLLWPVLLLAGCRVQEEVSVMDAREATHEISLEGEVQRKKSIDTSGSASEKSELLMERTERQSGGSVQLSPPDSTGAQYPVVVNWYSSDIDETARIMAEMEMTLRQKMEEDERRSLELQERMEALEVLERERKTSKSGFTFLEKIGFITTGLLVLIVLFTLIKWCLKSRK